MGGVLCFALARHLSTPLLRVARAANALAEGRLQTRIGGGVAGRRDEVGRLARDFDTMAGRIEALVAGQRRLLGDVSHELRSPLARLTVAAELARRDAPSQSAEYFRRIDTDFPSCDIRRADIVARGGIDHRGNRIVNGLHGRIVQIDDDEVGALPGFEASQVFR